MYTPREIKGWLEYAVARGKREQAEALIDRVLVASGNNKELKRRVEELRKE